MRIYTLGVPESLRPDTQGYIWPPDSDDYGVEQDFLEWLRLSEYSIRSPIPGDWLYAPVFWNRWYWQNPEERHISIVLHDYLWTLRDYTRKFRVFTVAEYGVIGEHPELDFGDITVFSASRRGDTPEIDIPLLLYPHKLRVGIEKRYLASFAGNYINDAVRWNTWDALKDRGGIRFAEGLNIRDYTLLMQESYIVLAPRGVGVQSFRFYEAMQAGAVPLLISDVDSRPFKKWIDWDACSLYRETHEGLYEFMTSIPLQELADMGKEAQRIWYEQLQYGKWCEYVIRELGER